MFQLLKNSLFVFLGACCYGVLSTIVKLAYSKGYEFKEVLFSQYFFGWLILLLLVLLFSRKKSTFKQFIRLVFVGFFTCLTGIFYYLSLQSIPASIAVVLLFQFTWMGVIIEAIAERTLPSRDTVVSVLVLFIGTILAGGIIGVDADLNLAGMGLGLLSAFTFSMFIFFSGRVETKMSPINRTFYISSGALILLLCVFSPKVLVDGSLGDGIWKYGILLGGLGVVLAVFLFAMGAPHLNTGLATILGAGELPVAIIASVIILHEQVTALQWIGIVIILIGIMIPQMRHFIRKKPNREPVRH